MRLLKPLLLLASLAVAEKVPVLTEPMVVSAHGTTLDAGGDSVYLAGKGRLGKYLRTSIQIQMLEAAQPVALVAEQPLLFVCGISHCVVGSDSIFNNGYGWSNPAGGALYGVLGGQSGVADGYANAGQFYGGSFLAGTGNYVNHFLVAGDAKVRESVYAYRSDDSIKFPVSGYRIKDSLTADWGHPLLGFNRHGFAVMAIPVKRGSYAIKSDSARYLFHTSRIDSLHADSLNWIVSDSDGNWLAYDQVRSVIYRKAFQPSGFTFIDSVNVPELKAGNHRTYQVSQVDSLIVFSTDSSVVFARWTREQFRILSIASIGKPVLATAFQSGGWVYDPVTKTTVRSNTGYLWATTGSELYSFKVVWQDPPVSGVLGRDGSETGLSVRGLTGNGAFFTWSGANPLPLEIVSLEGRRMASMEVRPGQSLSWHAPHQGMYLLKSSQGTRTFVVR